MKTFEIGKTYSMRSICDHECVWTYEVIARTASTITIQGKFINHIEVKKCRIIKGLTEIYKAEAIRPLGTYSMCPTLVAE